MISALFAASDLGFAPRPVQPESAAAQPDAALKTTRPQEQAAQALTGTASPADPKSLVAAQEMGKDGGGGHPGNPGAGGQQLTPEEQRIVQELQQTDAKVRAHEQAHAAAGGAYAGAPEYEYTRGPDGKVYAVSGEVSIDVSPESDPSATAAKMETVLRAASAPADPSAQDRKVAAQAQAELAKARIEENRDKPKENQSDSGHSSLFTAANDPSPLSLFDRARKAYEKGSSLAPPDDGAAILFQAIAPLVA